MSRRIALVAVGLSLLLASPAFPWGSLNDVPNPLDLTQNIDANTHRCIDGEAYDFLQQDPAFEGAPFPTFDAVDSNEGIALQSYNPLEFTIEHYDNLLRTVNGPGPDAEGATFYSEHYYNPRTKQGKAPSSVGRWFERLATQQQSAKAAAWGGHFLADLSVPFHINGMYGDEAARSYRGGLSSQEFTLRAEVTGDLAVLGHPTTYGKRVFAAHDNNFATEASRYVAAEGGVAYHDWFDPWYWNGVPGAATATSSHLTWEFFVPNCALANVFHVTTYSALWPGNPTPNFDDPIAATRETVIKFAQANAEDTNDNLRHYVYSSTDALLKSATSVATLWRASFSALRVNLTYELDPASLTGDAPAPVVEVHGKVGNFASELAGQVQLKLTPTLDACRIVEGEEIQTYGVAAPGVHPFGDWRLEMSEAGKCEVKIEAIGQFRTPDLQYASKTETISARVPKMAAVKLSVSLSTAAPEPRAAVVAEARFSRPFGEAVDYEWRCDGCAVTAQAGARATLQAPDSGRAVVRVVGKAHASQAVIAEAAATLLVASAATPSPQPIPPSITTTPASAPTPTLSQVQQGVSQTNATTSPPPTQAQTPPSNSTSPDGAKSAPTPVPSNVASVTPTSAPTVAPTNPSHPKSNDAVTVSLPEWLMGTWRDAMTARDKYRDAGQASGASAQLQAAAAEKQKAAETAMRKFWSDAKIEIDGLPAFVERDIAERERIYGSFIRSPPKDIGECTSTPNSVCQSDLDGRPANWRYDCFKEMQTDHAGLLTRLQAFLDKAKTAEALFAKAYDGDGGYAAAMQASEALWKASTSLSDSGLTPDVLQISGHSWQGLAQIDRDWRTKGIDTTLTYPCDDDSAPVPLKLSPIGPAVPSTPTNPPPTTVTALSASLAVDPATQGQTELTVLATASGGVAPYRYQWTAALRDSGDRAVYAAPVSANEKASASVKVVDAAGANATATLALEAPKIAVTIAKTSPAGSEIRIAEGVNFTASLTSDGKSVDAKGYVLRWEPSTEARFANAEGPGVIANNATFSRPGSVKVWVVALRRSGGALATVGESSQIELNVVGGSIALKVDPLEPLVGQEVRITAVETPRVDDKDAAYWWEYSGQAANAGPTADPRVYSLIPKDTKPISVTAHLKEKLHGDELAVKSVPFNARSYSISIANLGPAFGNSTTRPKVWRPGKGIVVLDKEIAANEDVGLRADVAPETAAQPLRYTWTVGAGATLTGNSNARETRVQRADAGAIEAAVEVRDAKDIVLGTASIAVQVTVSAADVATGAVKAAELAKLTNEAAASWSKGDIDAACQQGKAATAIDPGFTLTTTYCGGRDRILALCADADAALAKASADKSQIDKAQADLDQAKAINAKAKPATDLDRKIAAARNAATKVAELLANAAAAWRNGDAETALRDAQSALAQALTSVEAQQARRRYADASTALQTARGKARDAIDRKDYDGALAAIAEGKKVLVNDRALLQLEQEATRDKQGEAQQGADRQRRLQLLQAAAQDCNGQNWKECKAKLETVLDGADKAMKPEDAPALDQAHKLLAKANAALANTPTPANPPTPSAAPTSTAQCQQDEAAALAKQGSGDVMGAMALHAQALTACPKYCSAMRNVALGMDALGKKPEATQWAQLALQCDPNDGSIKAIAANHGIPTPAQTAAPTPPQPTPTPAPTATLAPPKPTPSPSATLAPPKPIATLTVAPQTIDGAYKGQLTVTKSIWKLSADGYTFTVTMSFTVNRGAVAGQIEGRADCGPQVKFRSHCGTFSAAITGTVDSGGGLQANYSGVFNWRQDDGAAKQRALSGDLAGQLGSGEGSGTFNLAEYNDSYKEWGFRSSGSWSATSTSTPKSVVSQPTPTAPRAPLQPTPAPTKTPATNPPPPDSNANPGSAQQCEDSYTHAERQFLIYVGSKEATDAKAAIEAYKATALGPCRGRVDACNAEAQISRLFGYIGDSASAAVALKQAHECSNAHEQ